jgi:mannose-6-phosphate isomerase-like protein (cupin superfamily)
MGRPGWRVALGLALAIGAASAAGGAEPVLDALFPEGRRTAPLRALAASQTLEPSEAFRIVEVGRDGSSSHHLVWIRDREIPHRHDRHDLLVVMLRGEGTMRLDGEERPVGSGSILWVPRGTPHAFRNTASEPAVAYAVYTPAFDGKDRVPVEPRSGVGPAPPTCASDPRACRASRPRSP